MGLECIVNLNQSCWTAMSPMRRSLHAHMWHSATTDKTKLDLDYLAMCAVLAFMSSYYLVVC